MAKIKTKALWLDCGNAQHVGQIVCGNLGDAKDKLPNLFDLYGELLQGLDEREEDSCSTEAALRKQDMGVNHTIAIQASNLLWQLIRHGEVDHHGCFIDIKHGEVNPLKVNPDVWASFGYQSKPMAH